MCWLFRGCLFFATAYGRRFLNVTGYANIFTKQQHIQLRHAGATGQLIVIFMHNIASGHEKSQFKAVGPNNTDPGCWPAFAQQCLLITDMTFDESRFDWNEINKHALELVLEAISSTVPQQTSSHGPVEAISK